VSIDLVVLRQEARWRGFRVSVCDGMVCLERAGRTEHFDRSPEGLEAAFDWLLTKLPPEQPVFEKYDVHLMLVQKEKPWWKWPWWEKDR